MDEKLRVKKVLQGDVAAFSFFVEMYQDMAVTIAYRICSNRQDAEDIVQDAFVKAYHNLHTFRLDSKFSTWFYRIVYNTAISHIKTSFFTADYADYTEADKQNSEWDTIEIIDENERKEILGKAMEKLPKDSSLILTLFYLDENSIKDIVQIMGLSEANVKVKLHRARKQLADILSLMMRND